MRRGRWTPSVALGCQFAGAASVAVLVLMVHSVHAHADLGRHAESTDPATASLVRGAASIKLGAFIDHAEAVADCMRLEFSAPRMLTLTLAEAGVFGLLHIVAATSQASIAARLEVARPPPATRRQALLGVFLS
jgi:hypothetical protein